VRRSRHRFGCAQRCSLILAEEDILFLGQTAAAARTTASLDNIFAEQADVLRSLTENPGRLLVTDAASALVEYPSRPRDSRQLDTSRNSSMTLKQEDFVKRLAFGGFERADFVGGNGEYAVRGGIVDVFPIGFNNPLRIRVSRGYHRIDTRIRRHQPAIDPST